MRRSPVMPDQALTDWCREILGAMGHARLASRLVVCWNPRMRTAAGRAFWPQARIELNPALGRFGDGEIRRTLKHELAHLLAHDRVPHRRMAPHGTEWRQACADLGIPGEPACHRLALQPRRPMRKHAYACPHCRTTLYRVRPILRAVACHACCRKHNHGEYDSRFRLVRVD